MQQRVCLAGGEPSRVISVPLHILTAGSLHPLQSFYHVLCNNSTAYHVRRNVRRRLLHSRNGPTLIQMFQPRSAWRVLRLVGQLIYLHVLLVEE